LEVIEAISIDSIALLLMKRFRMSGYSILWILTLFMMIQRLQSISIFIQVKICLMGQLFDLSTFEWYYVRFLLELRERHLLLQNIVQSITTYLYSLLEVILKVIRTHCSTPYLCRSSLVLCVSAVFYSRIRRIQI